MLETRRESLVVLLLAWRPVWGYMVPFDVMECLQADGTLLEDCDTTLMTESLALSNVENAASAAPVRRFAENIPSAPMDYLDLDQWAQALRPLRKLLQAREVSSSGNGAGAGGKATRIHGGVTLLVALLSFALLMSLWFFLDHVKFGVTLMGRACVTCSRSVGPSIPYMADSTE